MLPFEIRGRLTSRGVLTVTAVVGEKEITSESYLASKGTERDKIANRWANRPELRNGFDDNRQAVLAIVAELEATELEAYRQRDAKDCKDSVTTIETVCLADIETEPIYWLWANRIPLGKITIIMGDPDVGKSFLTLDIASRVTTAAPWPDDPNPFAEPGSVVILSAEDSPADTIRPRLDAMGADVGRIHILTAVTWYDGEQKQFDLSNDIPALRAVIEKVKPLLVIVDPLSAYLGTRTDSHKDADIRSILAPLAALASEYRIAIVAVLHMNKQPGGRAIYRASGSLAFTAAARVVFLVTNDRDDNPDDEADRRKLVLTVKCNIARRPPGLSYRIGNDLALQWGAEPVNVTADEAVAEPVGKRGPEPTARQEAETFILKYLGEHGTTSANILEAAALDAGHSESTFGRARRELKRQGAFTAERTGRTWFWTLADDPTMPSDAARTPGTDNLNNLNNLAVSPTIPR